MNISCKVGPCNTASIEQHWAQSVSVTRQMFPVFILELNIQSMPSLHQHRWRRRTHDLPGVTLPIRNTFKPAPPLCHKQNQCWSSKWRTCWCYSVLFFFLWKSQRYRQIYRQTKVNQFKVVLVLHLTLHYQHTEVDSSFRSFVSGLLEKDKHIHVFERKHFLWSTVYTYSYELRGHWTCFRSKRSNFFSGSSDTNQSVKQESTHLML